MNLLEKQFSLIRGALKSRSLSATCGASPPKLWSGKLQFLLGLLIYLLDGRIGAHGQGTVVFRNFSWEFVGTNRSRVDRPVFLPDGVTRASGSNYVVEFWVQVRGGDFKLVATTSLLTGTQAGLFQGGDNGYVDAPVLCSAIVRVQVWDRTSGTNFDSATIRGGETFLQMFGGSCCEPPCIPFEMTGFTSLCLGKGECDPWPTTIGFESYPTSTFVVGEQAGLATITVRRTGELGGTNTVTYDTKDGTAIQGMDYVAQQGALTFLPLEMSKSFTIPLLQTGDNRARTVRLGLNNLSSGVRLAPGEGTLWILRPGGAPLIKMLSAAEYEIWAATLPGASIQVEASTNLASTNWQVVGGIEAGSDHNHTGVAAGGGQDLSGFPYRFYRAVLR